MNIAIAKLGKSIKFIGKFSPIGGDNEAPNIFTALINNNPDTNFYITGISDFARISKNDLLNMFPYGNVFNIVGDERYREHVQNGIKDKTNAGYKKTIKINKLDAVENWLKDHDVKIDLGIFMVGQVGTVTIPDRIKKINDPTQVACVIDMTKTHTTMTIDWLNKSQIPFLEIVNDPRYTCAQSRDFFNSPKRSIGQYDYSYKHNKIISYENQDRILIETPVTYNAMEYGFLINRKKLNLDEILDNKEIDFAMILNEGDPSRYKQISYWILDHNKSVEIYGKWSQDKVKDDSRFKGSVTLDETQDIITKAKYTLIIPIAGGWVTSKWVEMVHAGTLPFFPPEYDTQKHLKVPEFIRVKDPIDLQKKIKTLNENPEMYRKIMHELSDMLDESKYDGTFMNDIIMEAGYSIIDKEYIRPKLASFKLAVKENLFEDFF